MNIHNILTKVFGDVTVLIYNSKLTHYWNKLYYQMVAHPFKTIQINPRKIVYKAKILEVNMCLGQIEGGDWDVRLINNSNRLDQHPIYVGLTQRFVQNRPWKETEYVQFLRNNPYTEESGERYAGLEDFVDQRCEYIDNLFHDLKNNGFLTFRERNPYRSNNGRKGYRQHLDPIIYIGRSGDFFLRGGHHRHAIASILDIQMPVQIAYRHKKWQEVRERVGKNSGKEYNTNREHPDLQDII